MKLERDLEAIEAYDAYLTEVSDIAADERAQIQRDLDVLNAGLVTVEPGEAAWSLRYAGPVRSSHATRSGRGRARASRLRALRLGTRRRDRAESRRIGNGNGFKMGSLIGPVPNRHRFIDNWAYGNYVEDFSENDGEGFLERRDNVCGLDQEPCAND